MAATATLQRRISRRVTVENEALTPGPSPNTGRGAGGEGCRV